LNNTSRFTATPTPRSSPAQPFLHRQFSDCHFSIAFIISSLAFAIAVAPRLAEGHFDRFSIGWHFSFSASG